ncbi:MAG: BatA domain-containing protein [Lentisphaerae bacterium]|nr:BatA domain-containing protein [Lentisphaerota bacterium]
MTFLAPLFLLGIGAALIPLIVHLRRSRRAVRIVFSTARFFDEDFIRSARRARLQDLLLMLLRMALLCLLALALAQPVITLPRLRRTLGMSIGRRTVALVIDDSASMALRDGDGRLFDRSRSAALEVLDGLSTLNGDRATVVLAGARDTGPEVLFEEPSEDLEAVRASILLLTPADLGTDLARAVEKAAAVIGSSPDSESGRGSGGEVYVFSDMQAAGFEGAVNLSAGPLASLVLVSASPDASLVRDNLSVDAIQYGSPRPLTGVPFSFRVLLTNHGKRPRTASVRFRVEGKDIARQRVDLAPSRSRVVRFVHRFGRPGWSAGEISLAFEQGDSPDGLDVDNCRYFAVHVLDQLRVLAVNGAPSELPMKDELFFFRLAMSAAGPDLSPVVIDHVRPDDITPERLAQAPVTLLANVARLSPGTLKTLERHVDAGGSLFVALGDRVDPEVYGSWIGEHRLHGGLLPARLVERLGPDAVGTDFIAGIDDTHPALAGFGDARLGTLTSVRFSGYYHLDPSDAAVLLSDSKGRPLMVEKQFGRGRVILFATTIDRDWTDLPLQPAYVPLLYRLLGYLSHKGSDPWGFVRTGQLLRLPTPAVLADPVKIVRPDGSIGYPQPDPTAPADASTEVFADTGRSGVYRVLRGSSTDEEPIALFAANLPDVESEPALLNEKAFEDVMAPDTPWLFVDDPEQVAEASRTMRHGLGLWDHFLIVALAIAIVEPWLANRLSRRRNLPGRPAS